MVGVSVDRIAEQKFFHENRKLPYPLVADVKREVINAFGVPTSEKGFAMRQAFLFKDGALVWKDETASTEEQASDVIAAIAKLGD